MAFYRMSNKFQHGFEWEKGAQNLSDTGSWPTDKVPQQIDSEVEQNKGNHHNKEAEGWIFVSVTNFSPRVMNVKIDVHTVRLPDHAEAGWRKIRDTTAFA
jgi:hypothetical protein